MWLYCCIVEVWLVYCQYQIYCGCYQDNVCQCVCSLFRCRLVVVFGDICVVRLFFGVCFCFVLLVLVVVVLQVLWNGMLVMVVFMVMLVVYMFELIVVCSLLLCYFRLVSSVGSSFSVVRLWLKLWKMVFLDDCRL